MGRLAPLGGGEQPAEEADQPDDHRPVAVREDQVASHDRDRAERRTARASAPAATAGSPWRCAAPAACSARTHRRRRRAGRAGRRLRRRRPVAGPGARRRHPAAGLALRRSHGATVYEEPSESSSRTTRVSSAAAQAVRGDGPPSVASSGDAGAGAGQLRQLRVQPRAVPRRARGRADRPPQRRHRRRRGARAGARRRAHLARPGRPEDSGIICDAVAAFAERGTPVLGVCLGHQAIGHVYGASIVGATELMHGKTSPIDHDRHRRLRRPAVTADGDALPLADDRPGDAARRPRGHGDDRRRHDHGRAPPPPRRRGRPVPPRERPHRQRPRPPARPCSPAATERFGPDIGRPCDRYPDQNRLSRAAR